MMQNMKMSKAEAKTMLGEPAEADGGPEYPYGLRISLSGEELAKLGCTDCKVGEKMQIMAMAEVVSTSENQDADDESPRKRVELQITDMGMGMAEAGAADKMYGKSAMKP